MEMIYRSNSRMKSSFRSKTWIESQSFKRTEKTSQIGRANKKNPIILGERELAAESSSTVWIGFGRNRGCWKLLIICLLGSLHLWLLMYTYIYYIYIYVGCFKTACALKSSFPLLKIPLFVGLNPHVLVKPPRFLVKTQWRVPLQIGDPGLVVLRHQSVPLGYTPILDRV